MRKSVCCATIAVAMSLAGLSVPAHAKTFSGNYTVTIAPNSYCLTFTNTSGVSGYRNSGTWSTPFTDFSGYFVVSQGKLYFYGNWGIPENFISAESKLGTSAGFWTVFTYPLISPGNAGTFTMTPGC